MNGCVDYLRHEILWRVIQCQCNCLPSYEVMCSAVAAAAAAGWQIVRLFANMEFQYLRWTKTSASKANRSKPTISSNSLGTREQFYDSRTMAVASLQCMRCAPPFPFIVVFIFVCGFLRKFNYIETANAKHLPLVAETCGCARCRHRRFRGYF